MRTGVDARTGKVLTGWDHCAQSIGRCIAMRFRTMLRRRHLASLVPVLQDQNADPRTIFEVYRALAEAINDPDGGEPGFNLQTVELVEFGRAGRFVFLLSGQFFPRGHLGDYSIYEDRSLPFAAGDFI